MNDLTSVELSNLRRATTWASEFTTKQHIILSTAWEAFLLQLRSSKMLHFRTSSGKADLLKMALLNRNKWALPTPRSREESSVRAALGIRLTWQQSGFCVRSAVGFVIKSQQSWESSFSRLVSLLLSIGSKKTIYWPYFSYNINKCSSLHHAISFMVEFQNVAKAFLFEEK